ncbi:MAG: M28 family peptidase [Bacteroidales bacterium]|nr:M28 family peptidase [Bacteroidales bacterium]
MKIGKVLVFAVVMVALCPLRMVAQTPSIDSLIDHIRELSSSKYEGRLAGTEGYMEAADYVIEQLAQYGVQPYKGEWAQYFETERNKIENCTFNSYVNANDARQVYVLGKDFVCAGMTGRGYAEAPVVFCGYGIDSPAFDEYEKVDAKGKIVMVLSGVPSWLPSKVTENYRYVRDKARVAQKHGACALVVVNMSVSCPSGEVQGTVYGGELPHLATFPIIMPTRDCASRLLKNETLTFDEAVQALQNRHEPQSFHLRKKFAIDVNANYHPAALTANVIGIYPGVKRSMANEYVVVGAQLDGVGMQGTTCLFPGADDNATGVAALMEVARMLSESPDQPNRSVIFVLFSAGEQQHLGSRIFVSNFTPLNRIEAYVDVNSIGMGDSILVLGNMRYPDLWNVALKVDSLYCTRDMVTSLKTSPVGDATAFFKVGIPSINITNMGGSRHVRVPSDMTENIDRTYIVKATQLLFETVLDLSFGEYQGRSNASKRIKFTN